MNSLLLLRPATYAHRNRAWLDKNKTKTDEKWRNDETFQSKHKEKGRRVYNNGWPRNQISVRRCIQQMYDVILGWSRGVYNIVQRQRSMRRSKAEECVRQRVDTYADGLIVYYVYEYAKHAD